MFKLTGSSRKSHLSNSIIWFFSCRLWILELNKLSFEMSNKRWYYWCWATWYNLFSNVLVFIAGFFIPGTDQKLMDISEKRIFAFLYPSALDLHYFLCLPWDMVLLIIFITVHSSITLRTFWNIFKTDFASMLESKM